MIYVVEIFDEVFYDVESAILYYELQVEGLGMRFYSVFQDTIKIISSGPNLFNRKQKNYRQVKMKNFPYYLVYEVENQKILVSRLFHVKRDPKSKYKFDV